MSDKVGDEDFSYITPRCGSSSARRWCRGRTRSWRADRIPDDLRAAAAQMGLFGYAIPPQWGGLGLDLGQDVELAMEFGYTTLSLRSMFGTNNGIAGQVLVGFGTENQKKQWLERIATGEVVASFALTEPGAGSNPAGLRTRARRDGEAGSSTGRSSSSPTPRSRTSSWSSPAPREPRPDGPGIAVFLVPADTAGRERRPQGRQDGPGGRLDRRRHLRRRPGPSIRARRRGRGGTGYRAAMTSLARGRVHIAALAVGCAAARPGRVGGLRRGQHPGRSRIGDTSWCRRCSPTSTPASPRAARWSATPRPPTTPATTAGSRRRRRSCSAPRWPGRAADLAVQVHGGSGYMREVPVERIYRDVRLLRLYEGTSEIQRLIIGGGLVRDQREIQARHTGLAGPWKAVIMREVVICEPVRTPIGRYGGALRRSCGRTRRDSAARPAGADRARPGCRRRCGPRALLPEQRGARDRPGGRAQRGPAGDGARHAGRPALRLRAAVRAAGRDAGGHRRARARDRGRRGEHEQRPVLLHRDALGRQGPGRDPARRAGPRARHRGRAALPGPGRHAGDGREPAARVRHLPGRAGPAGRHLTPAGGRRAAIRVFAEEIIPVTVRTRQGEVVVDTDEHPRADASLETLAGLRPVLGRQDPEATVTAGNASGQNDAAAMCIVTHPERAATLGLGPWSASCHGGLPECRPRPWGSGPSPRAGPRWNGPG